MKTSIDFGKLANETLQVMSNDAGFPEEFRVAVAAEQARRKTAAGLLPEKQRGVSASFNSGGSNRLVKAMEKRAKAAAER